MKVMCANGGNPEKIKKKKLYGGVSADYFHAGFMAKYCSTVFFNLENDQRCKGVSFPVPWYSV